MRRFNSVLLAYCVLYSVLIPSLAYSAQEIRKLGMRQANGGTAGDIQIGTSCFVSPGGVTVCGLNGTHIWFYTDNTAKLEDLYPLAAKTPWRLYYTNGSGVITPLAFGASGTYLKSAGASAAPFFDTPAGGGDVSGPASSTDRAVVIFDSTTGKIIKMSGCTIAADNTLSCEKFTVGSGAYGSATLSREWYYGHVIQRNNAGTGPSSMSFVPGSVGGGAGIVVYHDVVTTSGTGRRGSFELYYTLAATRGPLLRMVSESDGAAVFPVSLGLTPNNATPANYTNSIFIDNGAMVGGSVGAFGDVVVNDNQALWVKTQTAGTNSGKTASTAYVDSAINLRGGYTLSIACANNSTLTDAQTAYFGGMAAMGLSTSESLSPIYIPITGTITKAYVSCYAATAGTNESWEMLIRKNAATDASVASLGAATNNRLWSNTAMSLAVTAGDYVQIKSIAPTWGTNPANFACGGVIYVAP